MIPPLARGFVQQAGVLDAQGSPVPHATLWRGSRALTTAPDRPAEIQGKLDGTWLYGGVLWPNFAHFLVESTARLWALETKDAKDLQGIAFLPKNPSAADAVRDLHTEFLQLLGHDLPIHVAANPMEVENLVVPGQGFGLGQIVTGTQRFRDVFRSRFAAEVEPDGPDKIYISRSPLGPGRDGFVGEDMIEHYLEESGYEIFHPQQHSLTVQIARYKAATHVIAAEGPAMHLFAFVASAHQKVAMILRRRSPATANIEAHVQAFAGYAPLTIDAIRRAWAPTTSHRKRLYVSELDMRRLQSALVQASFVEHGPTWENVPQARISETLGAAFKPAGKSLHHLMAA